MSRKTVKSLRRHKCVAHAIAHGVYSAVQSALGSRASDLLREKRFGELVNLSIDPNRYDDPDTFRDDYLVVSLMSKFPSWDIGIKRDEVAIQKFLESEASCGAVNTKSFYGAPSVGFSPAAVIHTAKGKIEALLGPFSWDEASKMFGWGPGASTCVPKRLSDAYYKFGVEHPEVTQSCALLAACEIFRTPLWYQHLAGLSEGAHYASEGPHGIAKRYLKIIRGSRICTVPKNAKTDRIIAVEPHMNMYLQRGIGGCIRRRLKRVGVDLDDQTRNQRLALEGSVSGVLCTMDLSAASDSISMRLVEELLPSDWALAMKLTRSPEAVLPSGEWITLQKVSSMGNGFTFELESLIFWAIVSSVVDLNPSEKERRVSVYGDDLIFSSSLYHSVDGVLGFCGFRANESKSFYYGYFRESCGKHYFGGRDVSPFYIREDVDNAARLTWAANEIWRFSERRFSGLYRDARFEVLHGYLVNQLPSWARESRIPDGYGDIGLISAFDEACPQRAPRGFEGFVATVWAPEPKLRRLRLGVAGILKALSKGSSCQRWWELIEDDFKYSHRIPAAVWLRRSEGVLSGSLSLKSRCDTVMKKTNCMSKNLILIPQWEGSAAWL